MTIRDFFRTVWSGKYYVLLSLVIVLGATYVYLNRQETQFQATATVQLNSSESVPGVDEVAEVTVNPDTSLVTSDEVVEAAAEELGHTGSATALVPQVQATYDPENLVMEITTTNPDPAAARAIANAFAEAYVAHLPAVLADQIDQLDQRREALREQLSTVNRQLRSDPDDPLAGAELDTIVSQYQAISAQISTFQSIVVPAQVLSPATGAVPLGIGRRNVLALATLAGIVAGVGLSLVRRSLDPRIRSAPEAATVADSPILAQLQLVDRAHRNFRRSGKLPILSRAASPFTESIRELRTAAQVSLPQTATVVLVVTATDPRAPRAFITANLAASWAFSGRRTIAVSADLRQPQLDRLLPPPETWEGDSDETRPTRVPNLSLLPVPEVPLDPADYLASADARSVIENLRGQADIVVVDAPPALAGADATILSGYADGVVMIISGGATDRGVLQQAVDRLRTSHAPLIGLAYTGTAGGRRMVYATTYGSASESVDADRSHVTGHDDRAAEVELDDDVAASEPSGRRANEERDGTRDTAAGGSRGGATTSRGHDETSIDT